MADTANQASKTSSLCAALAKHSTTHKYAVGMSASDHPGVFREMIEIRSSTPTVIASASTAEFVLPKSGILRSAWLRVRIKGIVVADNVAVSWSKNIAAAIIANISFRTNSRELLSIDTAMMQQLIERSVNKQLYKKLQGVGYDQAATYNTVATTTASDALGLRTASRVLALKAVDFPVEVYCPIMLTPFIPGSYANKIDLGFTETCSIQVQTRALPKFCATLGTVPTALELTLCCDIQALSATVRDQVVKQNYKMGSSAQMLWERHSLIAKSLLTAPADADKIQRVPVSMTLTSTDLCRGLTFVAVAASNDDTPAALHTPECPVIERVVFSASGRTLVDQTRESSMFMNLSDKANQAYNPEVSNFNSEGVALTAGSKAAQAPEANAMHVKFCDSDDASRFSGALALSGLSSQSATVYVRARNDTPFRVHCYSTATAVYSVQSSSGAILSSLSI